MRALEITLFCLLIPMVASMVNVWAVMDNTYEYTPDLSRYGDKTVSGLSNFEMGEDANIIDWAMFSLTMAIQFIFWALQILLAIVWLFPMLVKMFGVPELLAGVLQVGIWALWVIGVIQIKHAVSFDTLR
jgi:hypothetical protein